MSRSSVTITSPDPARAVEYFLRRLEGTPLPDAIGTETLKAHATSLRTVTASDPPSEHDFNSGLGEFARVPRDWLVDRAVAYFASAPRGVVLLEDLVSAADDPCLSSRPRPPFWCFAGSVYWPVVGRRDAEAVELAFAWASGGRELCAFGTLPPDFDVPSGDATLPAAAFHHIARSVRMLATDVYDWDGYMIWGDPGGTEAPS